MKEKIVKKLKKWGAGSFVIGVALMLFYGLLGVANPEADGIAILFINSLAIIGLLFTAFGAGVLFTLEISTMWEESDV